MRSGFMRWGTSFSENHANRMFRLAHFNEPISVSTFPGYALTRHHLILDRLPREHSAAIVEHRLDLVDDSRAWPAGDMRRQDHVRQRRQAVRNRPWLFRMHVEAGAGDRA